MRTLPMITRWNSLVLTAALSVAVPPGWAQAPQAAASAPAPAPAPAATPQATPAPAPAAVVVPVFTPFKATGMYEAGDTVGWTVALPEGATAPAGKYTYTVRKNQLDTLKTGEFELGTAATSKITIEVPGTDPSMVNVVVTPPVVASPAPVPAAAPAPVAAGQTPAAAPAAPAAGRGGRGGRGGGPNYALQLGAAVAPTQIKPAVPKPADFDAFWDAKLKALGEVPIKATLTEQPSTVEGVELSMIKIDSLNSTVQGYLAKPAREGKFPAIILYQYAGVYVIPPANSLNRAAQGWLCLNVDSHDVMPNSTEGVPRDYASVGATDRETSYFLNMYLRDTRAVQYIKSRPDWDGKTIVLMGTSMGGQQTLVTAGLNDGITAAVAWVPSGTDFSGELHGRKQGYPNWNTKADPKLAAAGAYFDVVNFAPRIKAPTFIGIGFLDTTSSPIGIWTAYNLIPGPKEMITLPRAAHNNQAPPETERAWATRSAEVVEALRKGEAVKAGGVK